MRQKIKEIIEKKILEACVYTGEKRTKQRAISASSIKGDNLQWVLKYRYGMIDDEKVSQSQIGTLVHAGLEEALKGDDKIIVEQRLQIDLKDDFVLSGAFDALIEYEPDMFAIIDHKTVKHKVIAKLDKEGKDSPYSIQQRIYKHLLIKTEPEKYNESNVSMFLNLLIKDGAVHMGTPDHVIYEIEDEWTTQEIEKLLSDRVDSLLPYIEDDKLMPEDCDNKFWIRAKGKKAVPGRCLHWCSVSDHCPWYKSYNKGQAYSKQKSENNILKSMISRSRDKNKDIRI